MSTSPAYTFDTRDVDQSVSNAASFGLFGAEQWFRYTEHQWQLWLFTYLVSFGLLCAVSFIPALMLFGSGVAVIEVPIAASVVAACIARYVHDCRKYFHSYHDGYTCHIAPDPPIHWLATGLDTSERTARRLALITCPELLLVVVVAALRSRSADTQARGAKARYYDEIETASPVGPALRRAVEARDKLVAMKPSETRDVALTLAQKKIAEISSIPAKIAADEDRVRAANLINELLTVDEAPKMLMEAHREEMSMYHDEQIRTALDAAMAQAERQLGAGQQPSGEKTDKRPAARPAIKPDSIIRENIR